MPNKKQLAKKEYEQLVADIELLCERFKKNVLELYWSIGKCIYQVDQKGNIHAAYGNGVMKKLAGHFTVKYGAGFSQQNLRRMLQLYLQFPKSPAPGIFKWTSFVEILPIKDQEKRRQLLRRAQEEDLPCRVVRTLVRHERAEGRMYTKTADTISQEKNGVRIKRLRKPRGVQLFTYRRVPKERFLPPRGYVAIDCGFSAYRILPRKDAPRCVEKPAYTYAATVTNVVDGDTLRITINAGYDVAIDTRVRVRGVNAAEISTPEGRTVKRKVQALLPCGSTIVVKTSGRDLYGRYRADVWFSDDGRCDEPELILRKGTYLNRYLLEHGLVDPM
jgi:endonuclease YncB( thermonuclease family)